MFDLKPRNLLAVSICKFNMYICLLKSTNMYMYGFKINKSMTNVDFLKGETSIIILLKDELAVNSRF